MTETRTTTWETIGTNVETANNNLDNILAEAKLDYTVECRPVTLADGTPIEGYQAVVRTTDNKIYNIAKKSYNVCQNRDAFAIVDEFGDAVKVVKAGETGNGLIYLIGEMPEIQVIDDTFKPHMILQNSHNAEFSLKSAIVPVRVVCQNQFNTVFHHANSFTVKHLTGIQDKVAEMNAILKNAKDYLEDFSKTAETLAVKKADFNRFLDQILPITADMTERKANNVMENRSRFEIAYNADDNANYRGTAWGLLNASMDFDTHRKVRGSQSGRFVTSIMYPEFTKMVTNMLLYA